MPSMDTGALIYLLKPRNGVMTAIRTQTLHYVISAASGCCGSVVALGSAPAAPAAPALATAAAARAWTGLDPAETHSAAGNVLSAGSAPSPSAAHAAASVFAAAVLHAACSFWRIGTVHEA